MRGFLLLLVGALARPVPEYTINLDLPPDQRFASVLKDFNASLVKLYNDLVTSDPPVRDMLFDFAKQRGNETAEFQAEIDAVARYSGVPAMGVHALQFLYELSTIMVPIENITFPFSAIPWRGPGCTGILAADKSNGGVVSHARNLDFSPGHEMQSIVYWAKFTKGGQEVFRSQMMAGYSCVVTAMKMGPNGFSVEVNTRFPDAIGGNQETFKNLLQEKRPLNGWTIRKIMETAPDYESAVKALSSSPYVAPQYNIVGGVKKGTILARDPDSVAYQLTMGQPNFECRDDYIIMTNFDFWWHDIREWFDPSNGEIGHPRRIEAQKILNATNYLTTDVLKDVISAKGVIAHTTIFQAIMSVELGLWNVSLTDM